MRITFIHLNDPAGVAEIAGNGPPAWVAYFTGYLKAAGDTDVTFVDATTHHLTDEQVRERIVQVQSDVIGCTAITPASHAGTFAGSDCFSGEVTGAMVVLRIVNNPLCRGLATAAPACDCCPATFERLFQVLVQRGATVHEVACEACGDPECRFEIRCQAARLPDRPDERPGEYRLRCRRRLLELAWPGGGLCPCRQTATA